MTIYKIEIDLADPDHDAKFKKNAAEAVKKMLGDPKAPPARNGAEKKVK